MTKTLLRNCNIIDVETGNIAESRDVLITDGKIVDIGALGVVAESNVIDVRGRFVMPGLCDAHLHATHPTMKLQQAATWSPLYQAVLAVPLLRDILLRGFTTVRDCGGAEFGLAKAIVEEHIVGPRLLYCGKALSQTGGHGDLRESTNTSYTYNIWTPEIGRICDGITEVRRAARDEIRRGAHHIKIMAAGGIASFTDPINFDQFAADEIKAIVEVAQSADIYVSAHAYTARSIARAVTNGVRSIEHGNFLDDATAQLIVERNAFLVPTLIVLEKMNERGPKFGMDPRAQAKIQSVWKSGTQCLDVAKRNGVKLVFGTDLGGELLPFQNEEFRLRSDSVTALEQVQSATINAAELFQMSDQIGQVKVGYDADLLVLEANPLDSINVLCDPERNFTMIMKGGKIYKSTL